jgi:hypothetical protein
MATPVVFMLHGTSGGGEKFYNISGWKEVGTKHTESLGRVAAFFCLFRYFRVFRNLSSAFAIS